MIYAFICEPHFRFGLNKPVGRTDSFDSEIKDKVNQIIELCKEVDCKMLVSTGDILDIKAPSLYDFKSIKEITSVFQQFQDNGITLLSIAGNHDLPSSSLDRKQESVFRYLCERDLIIDIENCEINDLCGFDYRPKKETLLELLATQPLEKICVIHEHLFPSEKDYTGFGEYLYYKDVAKVINNNPNSKCKVIVAGHLHKGFPTMTVDGIMFINPWSLTRLARDHYAVNNDHKPEVVFLDLDEMDAVHVELEHKPFNEAFNEKEVQRNLDLDVSIKDFVGKLNSFENNSDVTNAVDDIEGLSDIVKDQIKYYIEKASENA